MAICRKTTLAGLPVLLAFSFAAPAAAQVQPDLSGISDAQLEAERLRRLGQACASLRALGVNQLPAECSGSARAEATEPRAEAAPAPQQPVRRQGTAGSPATPAATQPRERRQLAQNSETERPAGPEDPRSRPGRGNGAETGADETEPGTETETETETEGRGGSGRGSSGNLQDDDDGRQNFGGIDFGIGLAFSLDLGERIRVREAELVNGIVRVSHSDNVRARLILETHYFFTPPGRGFPFLDITNPTSEEMRRENDPLPPRWGFGPFVAVQPGSDNIIDAIGGGIMLGLRRSTPGSDSFNLGLGVLYDIDVQTLGDGIFENQPLPDGETEIRFQRRAQSGLMIMTSYSF